MYFKNVIILNVEYHSNKFNNRIIAGLKEFIALLIHYNY